MEPHTRANGKEVNGMVMECRCLQMERSMWGNGWKTKLKDAEGLSTLMETYMRDNGSTIWLMDKVCTTMPTDPSTRDSGRKTSSTALAPSIGQMAQCTLAYTRTGEKMAREDSLGLMALATRVSLLTMTSTARACMSGRTREGTVDNGAKTRCTGKATSLGRTKGRTKVSICMTKSMVKAASSGQMDEATMDSGRTGSSMALVPTRVLPAKPERGSGRKEDEHAGRRNGVRKGSHHGEVLQLALRTTENGTRVVHHEFH
mmetsp:Transcript_29785/g.68596  ORF Transcript_29785/g.68596 Transcript_29785/m.68596 type:complete len:259 (+) Transcript_29785:212-988(+)